LGALAFYFEAKDVETREPAQVVIIIIIPIPSMASGEAGEGGWQRGHGIVETRTLARIQTCPASLQRRAEGPWSDKRRAVTKSSGGSQAFG